MNVYSIIAGFVILLGTTNMAYQLYKMVVLDATCRGIEKPKLWGYLATGGQNGGGLILYFIKRRKYPLTMTPQQQQKITSHKNKIGVDLVFIVIGTIGLLVSVILIDLNM